MSTQYKKTKFYKGFKFIKNLIYIKAILPEVFDVAASEASSSCMPTKNKIFKSASMSALGKPKRAQTELTPCDDPGTFQEDGDRLFPEDYTKYFGNITTQK